MEWSFQKKIDKKLARQKARQTWHKWFAWFPVSMRGHKKIWLETVYRKEDNYKGNWKYQTLMDFLAMEDFKDEIKDAGVTTGVSQGFIPSRMKVYKSPGVIVKEIDT